MDFTASHWYVHQHIAKKKNIPEIVTLTQEADRTEETDETQAMLRQLYRMINRLGQLEKSIILLYLEREKLRRNCRNQWADLDKRCHQTQPHQGQIEKNE